MATFYQRYEFQLYDRFTGKAIISSGGMCLVIKGADWDKATLYNPASNHASLTNPISLTRGHGTFEVVAGSPDSVDLYIMCPDGDFIVALGLSPTAGRVNPIYVDTQRRYQTLVCPYSLTDMGAGTTEYDTGLDFPTNAAVFAHGMGIKVGVSDAGETIDVGILSTEANGNATGFMAAVPITGTAGVFRTPGYTWNATGYVTAQLWGALVTNFTAGSAADDRGALIYKEWICDGTAKSLSMTPTSWDTAKGLVYIPYALYGR
jgi:hypothetical protein